jgi:hypothetical protein
LNRIVDLALRNTDSNEVAGKTGAAPLGDAPQALVAAARPSALLAMAFVVAER